MQKCVVIISTLIVAASPLSAQTGRVPDSVLQQASNSRWYVRALTIQAPHDTILGRARIYRDEFRVGQTAVDPLDLLLLERRTKSGYGAIAGGIIGAVVLGTAAYRFGSADETGAYNLALGTAVGAGVGGMIGLLAGNAISPGRTEWKRLWSSPARE